VPVQITEAWPGSPEGGPRPKCAAHVFFFFFLGRFIMCRLYKLNLSDETQVTLQLRVSLADLASRFLAGPPLWGARKIFHRGPKFRLPWGSAVSGIAGSYAAREHGRLSLLSLCCHVEVSTTGRSLVQLRLTVCGVSE